MCRRFGAQHINSAQREAAGCLTPEERVAWCRAGCHYQRVGRKWKPTNDAHECHCHGQPARQSQRRQTPTTMDEALWLSTNDPLAMLRYIRRMASGRKLRLFACACCRRAGGSKGIVAVVERYVDGLARKNELRDAAARAATKWEAAAIAPETARTIEEAISSSHLHAESAASYSRLLREIFGNPFRPMRIDQSWPRCNDGRVEKMARAIYDDRRFTDLPFLADALAEAGCTDEDILAHCRATSEHVRGCWLLDALLGL
jgi:hypothetical protein